jgi:cytochrome c-type biogenesis protein
MSSLPLPIAAFLAGVLSFLSPCVLPLVPGYISLISGTGVEEMQAGETRLLRRVLLHSLMFVLGFSIVFIALGAAATGVGRLMSLANRRFEVPLLHVNIHPLSFLAGVVIIIFGLHLTGVLKIKALYADKRIHTSSVRATPLGAFVVGFAFAFGWTPCIGPILAVVLKFAADQDTVIKGVLLLAVYSAGLAVPFLLTSLGIERFLAFYSRFRRHLHRVEVASGVLLIVIGALILANRFTLLNNYLSFLNRFAL